MDPSPFIEEDKNRTGPGSREYSRTPAYGIRETIKKQRDFFSTHQTKDTAFRLEQLKRLRAAVKENEESIFCALRRDLGKPRFEAYSSEIGLFYDEIGMHIKKLKKWAKPVNVHTPLLHFPSSSHIFPEPYGVVLIVATWNYPFILLVNPLIGAISAGNCAVLKPAHYSRHTSDVMEEIISNVFPPHFVSMFKGGREVNQALLDERFDYIFFTGGIEVGKLVMRAAARDITPLTLELGGKNPCIVARDADTDLAAKRIVWGKFYSAGQTCIGPDYLLVHKDIEEALLGAMKTYLDRFYGKDRFKSSDYSRIINEKHFMRLSSLLGQGEIVAGGRADREHLFIEPTILRNCPLDGTIMEEEIFGPVLPVVSYDRLDEAVDIVNSHSHPLALYLFSNDKKTQEEILRTVPFGGGCINDTLVFFANPFLPFGGVGTSGMGRYRGRASFDTFTHYKSVMKNSLGIDNPIRYPPYKGKLRLLKRFLK
ncbi:MAG: aldehyde dehydrogenase [Spirochaetales bacterium]|nr:aldehyde dehydrogenase [Spirochaetales bacterium]